MRRASAETGSFRPKVRIARIGTRRVIAVVDGVQLLNGCRLDLFDVILVVVVVVVIQHGFIVSG